ncbi:MAG: hypothetical protein ACOCQO_02965, partial [Halanaerobiaceae bacterium]
LAANEHEYTIDINTRQQEIYGFGAATAWYQGWLIEHPNKDEIYDLIFKELGIDILRLQNWYGKADDIGAEDPEIVQAAEESLGEEITILMTSWVPPVELKSNDDLGDGGTLKKEDGEYIYDQFADYWLESLQAYKEIGIEPTYISIQNEPDYHAEWNSNLLDPEENEENAGYGKALDAVYNKLHANMDNPPKLLGPETLGIGNNTVQKYIAGLEDPEQLDGIAYHLYGGGDASNPSQYNHNLNAIAEEFDDMPIFQTEFNRGTGFETAWQMYTALVEGHVNSYLFWDLVWDGNGLVTLEFPWDKNRWDTEKGYFRTDHYYSMLHYSKYIEPGYRRVDVDEGHRKVKMSAFISPDEDELVVVFLNTFLQDLTVNIKIPGFDYSETETYQTIYRDGENKFENIGAFPEDNSFTIPMRSAITVRFLK